MPKSKEDTADFLRRMNERNEVVSADQPVRVGLDPVRERTDRERREKMGPGRARKDAHSNGQKKSRTNRHQK